MRNEWNSYVIEINMKMIKDEFLECTLNRNSKQREIRSYRLRGHFANNQEQSTISSRSAMGLVWLTNSMDSQPGTRSIRYDMQAFRCPLHG